MDFKNYQKLSQRTLINNEDNIANYALGLAGETGETIDYLKKFLYHGHDIDVEILIKELGDVLWYLTALCSIFEIEIEDVAIANVDKLQKRYPVGFDKVRSIKRNEDQNA